MGLTNMPTYRSVSFPGSTEPPTLGRELPTIHTLGIDSLKESNREAVKIYCLRNQGSVNICIKIEIVFIEILFISS